jgi:hypothetical protein
MSIDKMDFDTEFTSEEEANDMLNCIIEEIGKEAEKEDNQDAIVIPAKVKAVLYTYKALKYLTRGTGAKVTYKLNEPYKSMGSVSVVGKELSFCDSKGFVAAAKLASNLDVYPKTDGTMQIDFTFHGLTKAI